MKKSEAKKNITIKAKELNIDFIVIAYSIIEHGVSKKTEKIVNELIKEAEDNKRLMSFIKNFEQIMNDEFKVLEMGEENEQKLPPEVLDRLKYDNNEIYFHEENTSFIFYTAVKWESIGNLTHNLEASNLLMFKKLFLKLRKQNLLAIFLDDGRLHLTFNNSLFYPDFLNNLS
jgi:hypothetical protein